MVQELSEAATEAVVKNPMQEIRVGKVAVNIGVGRSGEPLEKAVQVLEKLTGKKPCRRKAHKTVKTFGIRMGEPIGCLVTLRGGEAIAFLKRALEALNNRLKSSSFDKHGNLAFGIKEHIEIPGTRYDPEIGIYGLNVSLSLERPGYRVQRRRLKRSKVGGGHRITREEAIDFVKKNFSVEVLEE
ncbi:MAG: 50S ribosomal protein L5 [Candidatus Bathyarchaeia archaeon]